MRRRDVLAAVAGAGGLAAGGWYVLGDGAGGRVSPVEVETIDARGSAAGTMRVPAPGQVTVVDVFSTGCAPCETETRRLDDVRGDLGDVRLVSVTNDAMGGTLTREDLRRWWRDNGGHWPVGLDDGGRLMRELDVTGLPTLAVVDREGRLAWKHAGLVAERDLLEAVGRVDR
ncbi:MAG: TlpA family protein disulfide reductase [Halobacteriaceae archaeon]